MFQHVHIRKHTIVSMDVPRGYHRSLALPDGYEFRDVDAASTIQEQGGRYGLLAARVMEERSGDRCRCIGLYDKGNLVAYAWALLRGGENQDYKIRKSDCYICKACVMRDYRGQGLFACIIEEILYRYCAGGVASAAVRPDNVASLKSFYKVGFRAMGLKRYIVISALGHVITIPHWSL